jgi:Tfp pilus assembly protein PilN
VQIKNRQQLLTILTLTAIGLLVLDKIVTPPLMSFWDKRSKQIVALQKQVKEGAILEHRKDYLRSRWAGIQAGALTNDTTAAEQQLWAGLNRWSQTSGISLNSILPQWKQGSDAAYKTLECRVDVSGSIDRLSRFLYALETDKMALKVQTVEMTAKDNNGSVINLGVQMSGLVLTQQEPKK